MVHWQPGMSLEEVEKDIILAALRFFQNNKTQVAQSLGLSIRTIDNKLEKYRKQEEALEEEKIKDEIKREKERDYLRGIEPQAKMDKEDPKKPFEYDEDDDAADMPPVDPEQEGEGEPENDESDDGPEMGNDSDYVDDDFVNEAVPQ